MKRKNGYLMTELGDTCYAVAAEDVADCPNVLVTMNRVGSVIWKLLEEEITAEQLVQALCDRFDAPADVIRADAEAFLNKLSKAGLLEQ